jgi:hypothetical protein
MTWFWSTVLIALVSSVTTIGTMELLRRRDFAKKDLKP